MTFPSNIDLSTLNGTTLTISGAAVGDRSGWSVASAGDVNGDGFDDVIIGAPAADQSAPGASYLVFGRPYNSAPTISGTPSVISNEDTTYTFAPTDFHFSDLDASDSLPSVTIASLPTDGKLWFDANGGSPADAVLVTPNQTLSVSDIAAGHLFFVPDTNENGTAYATFTYTVSDGIASSASGTLTIDASC